MSGGADILSRVLDERRHLIPKQIGAATADVATDGREHRTELFKLPKMVRSERGQKQGRFSELSSADPFRTAGSTRRPREPSLLVGRNAGFFIQAATWVEELAGRSTAGSNTQAAGVVPVEPNGLWLGSSLGELGAGIRGLGPAPGPGPGPGPGSGSVERTCARAHEYALARPVQRART